jgi:hypothetical protein
MKQFKKLNRLPKLELGVVTIQSAKKGIGPQRNKIK